jgi:hypothetical protein
MHSESTNYTETASIPEKEEMKCEEFRCDDEEIKTDYYTTNPYSEEKKANYSPYSFENTPEKTSPQIFTHVHVQKRVNEFDDQESFNKRTRKQSPEEMLKQAQAIISSHNGKCESFVCPCPSSKLQMTCQIKHRFRKSLKQLKAGEWCGKCPERL